MAVNTEFIGRTYPASSTYLVGREKIREFASSLGDGNPAFHDLDAARALGYSDLVAPPTFAIVISMLASSQVIFDPDLGLDYSRVVHGDQKFSYVRPIVAGDELSASSTVTNIRSVAGNDMVTVATELHDQSGELVCTTTSLLLSRGDTDAEQAGASA